ncbi:MAG TPA: DUF2723 domain-containing protein [Bdellovibrionota bacterium]|nr:DUF2723 domain-containing protein [Bdellovibrionota bacterium]
MIWILLGMAWLAGAAPSVHWLDTSELSLAGISLGVSHPPGQPPDSMLGNLFSWLPFGDAAFRTTLMSIASGVVAIRAVSVWLKRSGLLQNTGSAERRTLFLILGSVGLSFVVSIQMIRTEVYALTSALVWSAMAFAARPDRKSLFMAWLLWGFALATHPVVAAFALPFLIQRRVRAEPILALVGLSTLGYVALRSAAHAPWDFGFPNSFEALNWFLRGQLYKAYDHSTLVDTTANTVTILTLIGDSLGWIVFPLALLGFAHAARTRLVLAFRMALAAGIGLFPLATMTVFWPTNPDALGYLNPLAWMLGALAVVGSTILIRRLEAKKLGFLMSAGLVIWLIFQALNYWRHDTLRHDWSAHRHFVHLMEEPAPAARVELASFQTFSLMRYAQIVEGRRPDLKLHYRGLEEREARNAAVAPDNFVPNENTYWELAIQRSADNRYALRNEDKLLLPKLRAGEWFCRIGSAVSSDARRSSFVRTRKIQQDIPAGLIYPDEPLILNYLVKILLARAQG